MLEHLTTLIVESGTKVEEEVLQIQESYKRYFFVSVTGIPQG